MALLDQKSFFAHAVATLGDSEPSASNVLIFRLSPTLDDVSFDDLKVVRRGHKFRPQSSRVYCNPGATCPRRKIVTHRYHLNRRK